MREISLEVNLYEDRLFPDAPWQKREEPVGPGWFRGFDPIPPETLRSVYSLKVELVGWASAEGVGGDYDGEYVVVNVPGDDLLRRVPWMLVVDGDVREIGKRYLETFRLNNA